MRRVAAFWAGLVLVALLLLPGTATAAETCAGADTPITASTAVDAERTMLCLVNLHRKANGLDPLAMEGSLRKAARGHSEDMVARSYFCHSYTPAECDEYEPGEPESTPNGRAKAEGYNGQVGENIAADSSSGVSAQTMFTQWKNSPGHNANMLGTSYYVFGMGFALGYPEERFKDQGATGTQMFGTEDTGATDTASDLIVDDSAPPPHLGGDRAPIRPAPTPARRRARRRARRPRRSAP